MFPENEEYWKDIMHNRRNPVRDEVTRLTTAMYGFLCRHNDYCVAASSEQDIMSPLEFWDSKRPYGNKDIPTSIAFNLGWDYKRLLHESILPEFVEEEAWKLHELVKERIMEEERFLEAVRKKEIK